MARQGLQTPTWRDPFLEDRQLNPTMAGIDAPGLIMVMLIVLVMVAVIMVMIIALLEAPHLFTTPSSPQHPQRNGDNDRR
jgi:hypothetical protein